MRLIDADALLKEANKDGAYGYVDAKQIGDAPTIGAVHVVRCKDCKWWNTDFLPQDCGWCEKDNHGRLADWFCADGEVATVKNGDSKTSGDVKQCNQ